jgi:hypothetical protein
MAEAVAEMRPREERAHALGGAVEAISQHPLDPIGRLVLECRFQRKRCANLREAQNALR